MFDLPKLARRVLEQEHIDSLTNAVAQGSSSSWHVPDVNAWSTQTSNEESYARTKRLAVDAAVEDLDLDPLTEELVAALTED